MNLSAMYRKMYLHCASERKQTTFNYCSAMCRTTAGLSPDNSDSTLTPLTAGPSWLWELCLGSAV